MTADIQFVYAVRQGMTYRISASALDIVATGQLGNFGNRVWWYDHDTRQIFGFEWVSEINAWVEYFEADRRKDAEYYREITDQYEKERRDIQMRATEQLERAAREYDRKRREISWDRRQYYRQLNDDNYLEGRPNIWDEKEKKMREERGL